MRRPGRHPARKLQRQHEARARNAVTPHERRRHAREGRDDRDCPVCHPELARPVQLPPALPPSLPVVEKKRRWPWARS